MTFFTYLWKYPDDDMESKVEGLSLSNQSAKGEEI